MRYLQVAGRTVFGLGMIALALLGFAYKDFIIGRPPVWPEAYNFNPGLGYAVNFIVILAGLAILVNRKAKGAAFVIGILILLLSASRHLSHFLQDWLNTYKTFAIFGGCLIVAASLDTNAKRRNLLIWGGSVFLAIFFVASGYAHFLFSEFVIGFIPAYIPLHSFFAYFTAICLIAGGIGLLIPPTRKYAALLSGIMLAGWFLLLHIPRFLADTTNMSDRMGLCESFTLAGVFFVLAGISHSKSANP